MTIKEFATKNRLLNSELITVEYDEKTHSATFVLNKNGFIGLKFSGVTRLEYDGSKGNDTFGNTIHDVKCESDGTLIFNQSDDDTFDRYETVIKAESVEIEPLPDYVDGGAQ